MKSLNTLIKIKQRELDALRRQLVEQEQALDILIKESKRLAEELERERDMAAQMPEMSIFYGKFAEGIEEKQEEIRKKSREINRVIRQIQEQITAAFTELKRFEITKENRLAAEEEEKNKQEQARLDEIGIQQFIRKEKV